MMIISLYPSIPPNFLPLCAPSFPLVKDPRRLAQGKSLHFNFFCNLDTWTFLTFSIVFCAHLLTLWQTLYQILYTCFIFQLIHSLFKDFLCARHCSHFIFYHYTHSAGGNTENSMGLVCCPCSNSSSVATEASGSVQAARPQGLPSSLLCLTARQSKSKEGLSMNCISTHEKLNFEKKSCCVMKTCPLWPSLFQH